MAGSLSDCTVLNNGVKMPWIGLGVFQVTDHAEATQAVKWAIEAGYRSIDTAMIYRNEEAVGRGIRESGVPREELFITTKVWNDDQGYDSTLRAFEESRKRLGLEYLDLYLIHWPGKSKYKETWKALIKLREEGWVRAIGVSNFHIHHLEDIMEDSGVVPAVNQVELHPWLTQKPLLDFCKRHNIQVESWSPLAKGQLLDHPTLTEIGRKYGKTPAQVIIRWNLQLGIVTIPKSVKRERIIENADVFDFELTPEEIAAIDALNEGRRTGPNPDEFIF